MRFLIVMLLAMSAALELSARVLGRPATRSRVAPERDLLVYDDDCGVCWGTAMFVGNQVEVELVPFSSLPVDGVLDSLSEDEIRASAHYVTRDGIEYHGGESMTRVARNFPRGAWVARALDLPVLRGLREIGYRLVAGQRSRISELLGIG